MNKIYNFRVDNRLFIAKKEAILFCKKNNIKAFDQGFFKYDKKSLDGVYVSFEKCYYALFI